MLVNYFTSFRSVFSFSLADALEKSWNREIERKRVCSKKLQNERKQKWIITATVRSKGKRAWRQGHFPSFPRHLIQNHCTCIMIFVIVFPQWLSGLFTVVSGIAESQVRWWHLIFRLWICPFEEIQSNYTGLGILFGARLAKICQEMSILPYNIAVSSNAYLRVYVVVIVCFTGGVCVCHSVCLPCILCVKRTQSQSF